MCNLDKTVHVYVTWNKVQCDIYAYICDMHLFIHPDIYHIKYLIIHYKLQIEVKLQYALLLVEDLYFINYILLYYTLHQ